MGEHSAAEIYISEMRNLRATAQAVHNRLVSLGCTSYVKTIYVGYDFGGEMVAAMYALSEHIEVALALPEDLSSPILIDASHLTWRTLPLAAVLRTKTDLAVFAPLAELACIRVRTSTHHVHRDNEFFTQAKRARRP